MLRSDTALFASRFRDLRQPGTTWDLCSIETSRRGDVMNLRDVANPNRRRRVLAKTLGDPTRWTLISP